MRISIILAALLLSPAALGATFYVPDDYASIQEAITWSESGDTIIVRPGLYAENIDFLGKGLLVTSEQGPEVTIIDGRKLGSVAVFINGEGSDAVLEGFTLTNGNGTEGINGVRFGGGVFCENTSPRIRNNIIRGNDCATIYGHGGGISCKDFFSSPVIESNRIFDNAAGYYGGGIHCFDTAFAKLSNNIVYGNSAVEGGGIACYDAHATEIYNNTITMNAAARGGGIYNGWFSSGLVANSILWNNTASPGKEIYIDTFMEPSYLSIDHSNVDGGKASIYVEAGCTLDWGEGMIDADPLFIEASAHDFHLYLDSPCMNTGNSSIPGLPEEDFEGDPRVAFGVVDMGADEFHIHLYHTGVTSPGGSAKIKITGWSLTAPVVLWVGSGLLDVPLHSTVGDWYLEFPVIFTASLGSIPNNGVYVFPYLFSPGFPAPWDIPVQALCGYQLTNPDVLHVK